MQRKSRFFNPIFVGVPIAVMVAGFCVFHLAQGFLQGFSQDFLQDGGQPLGQQPDTVAPPQAAQSALTRPAPNIAPQTNDALVDITEKPAPEEAGLCDEPGERPREAREMMTCLTHLLTQISLGVPIEPEFARVIRDNPKAVMGILNADRGLLLTLATQVFGLDGDQPADVDNGDAAGIGDIIVQMPMSVQESLAESLVRMSDVKSKIAGLAILYENLDTSLKLQNTFIQFVRNERNPRALQLALNILQGSYWLVGDQMIDDVRWISTEHPNALIRQEARNTVLSTTLDETVVVGYLGDILEDLNSTDIAAVDGGLLSIWSLLDVADTNSKEFSLNTRPLEQRLTGITYNQAVPQPTREQARILLDYINSEEREQSRGNRRAAIIRSRSSE